MDDEYFSVPGEHEILEGKGQLNIPYVYRKVTGYYGRSAVIGGLGAFIVSIGLFSCILFMRFLILVYNKHTFLSGLKSIHAALLDFYSP